MWGIVHAYFVGDICLMCAMLMCTHVCVMFVIVVLNTFSFVISSKLDTLLLSQDALMDANKDENIVICHCYFIEISTIRWSQHNKLDGNIKLNTLFNV